MWLVCIFLSVGTAPRSTKRRSSAASDLYKSSNTGIYAQVIDDVAGVTLASASTLDKEVSKGTKTEQAIVVGKLVAERAVAKGISEVVFDRGGYLYHGRVKALADSARENGLKF